MSDPHLPPPLPTAPQASTAQQSSFPTQQLTVVAPQPSAELLAEKERLTERFALLQADLGGAFYEMAIRDHVRLDVLTLKAAELQRVDIQLAEIESTIRGEAAPQVGSCAACGAAFRATDTFCSSCGTALAVTSAGVPVGAAPTHVLPSAPTSNGSNGHR